MNGTTAFLLVLCTLLPSMCLGHPLIGREDAVQLVERLAPQTQEYYDSLLAGKPYFPSLMAWGMQYLVRTCLIMYHLTEDEAWLWQAVKNTDYFVECSDVNGDGIPSWGSYNESYGEPRFGYVEWTVWDGVIGYSMLEVAKVIRSRVELSSNPNLSSRADAYVDLVSRVVERHYPSWNQVKPDQGYYWDDPKSDLGPYVNGFAALGRAEIMLFELTGNQTYLDRPRQMANFILANMRYDKIDDLYTWEYKIGQAPAEDISHGAIDLEFLLLAHGQGLVAERDILRICNTYVKRIWTVPRLPDGYPLAMRVDGSGGSDYTTMSRGWILLARSVPAIYEMQRVALGVEHERYGLSKDAYVLLAVAQVPYVARELISTGVDPGILEVLDPQMLSDILSRAQARLDLCISAGSKATHASSLLEQAATQLGADPPIEYSIPIALIWRAYDDLGRILESASKIGALVEGLTEAEDLGAEVADLWGNLARLREDFSGAEQAHVLDSIDAEVGELSFEVQIRVARSLIEQAEDVVAKAKMMGIDTSRAEIFLGRAKEEFEKGNYGPARRFTEYPLRLREAIGEGVLAAFSLLALLLARVLIPVASILVEPSEDV